jgi:DNA-binding transcriptional regulator YdaS (Cro superfamily)
MTTPFEKACEIVGASKLAQILNVSPQAVSDWRKQKRAIPIERCAQIEMATQVAVTCEQLRPDKSDFWAYMRLPGSNPPMQQSIGETGNSN